MAKNKSNTLGWVVGIIILAVIIIGAVLIFTPKETGAIKIGAILPLTGDAATIGQNTRQAMELAVEEINNAGGINSRNLEIIFEDGKCGAKDSTNAANKLVNIDGVPIIIGGLCSSETLAAAPIAESNKVVLFSPCSTSPAVTTAGDYVFRDSPSDSFQGIYAADVVYNTLGKNNVAILYCLSDWCTAIKEVFKTKFTELNGTIVAEEGYEQTTKDLRTQLTKIKQAKPDALYFLGYTEASIIGLKQIKELGINVSVIGGDGWDDPKIWNEVKDAGEGVRYTLQYAALPESFKSKMKTKTGSEEITLCTPNAYDAVNIIANVMNKAGTNSIKIKDELYKVSNYQGVSGTITLDENGDLASADFVTKIVHNNTPKIEG